MANVRGCNLPDDLLYDVANHIWFKETGDGNVRVGMTAVATAMAGRLVAYTPKGVGKEVKAGKSCATVESGKWIGPAKVAAGGEVVAVNEAMVANPSIAAALHSARAAYLAGRGDFSDVLEDFNLWLDVRMERARLDGERFSVRAAMTALVGAEPAPAPEGARP